MFYSDAEKRNKMREIGMKGKQGDCNGAKEGELHRQEVLEDAEDREGGRRRERGRERGRRTVLGRSGRYSDSHSKQTH